MSDRLSDEVLADLLARAETKVAEMQRTKDVVSRAFTHVPMAPATVAALVREVLERRREAGELPAFQEAMEALREEGMAATAQEAEAEIAALLREVRDLRRSVAEGSALEGREQPPRKS